MRPKAEKHYCNNCGSKTKPKQEICVKCGVSLGGSAEIGEMVKNISDSEFLKKFSDSPVQGGVKLGGAFILFLFLRGHSPHMGFMEMMQDPNNWILKSPFYEILMLGTVLLALWGAINLYKHFTKTK
jgi:hypothetical protein